MMIHSFVGTVDGPAFIKIRAGLGGITVTSGRRIRSVATVGLLRSNTLPVRYMLEPAVTRCELISSPRREPVDKSLYPEELF
jgi:hypothetical protein